MASRQRPNSVPDHGYLMACLTHTCETLSCCRPSGGWSDDDYDVLANGEVVGHIYIRPMLRRSARLGCVHSRSGTTKVARRRTGMLRPERPPCHGSLCQELAAG